MNPGTIVAGRYLIERELGRGGMGSVHAAVDQKFGSRVAVKLAISTGSLEEFRARFAREARLGHLLGDQPGFVRVRDWGEVGDGRTLYLVMDLVEGAKPLDLKEGSLEDRVRRLATAATIVARLHEQGVIHRDLKPANFLVAKSGDVRLADFGLAKGGPETTGVEDLPTGGLTLTGAGMGTPTFMPPELFDDAKRADERADVYALGAMLFYAISGRLPFSGSVTEIISRQMKVAHGHEPAPRPGGPAVLEELCLHAIALDPAKRLGSVRELVARLQAATDVTQEKKEKVEEKKERVEEKKVEEKKVTTTTPSSSSSSDWWGCLGPLLVVGGITLFKYYYEQKPILGGGVPFKPQTPYTLPTMPSTFGKEAFKADGSAATPPPAPVLGPHRPVPPRCTRLRLANHEFHGDARTPLEVSGGVSSALDVAASKITVHWADGTTTEARLAPDLDLNFRWRADPSEKRTPREVAIFLKNDGGTSITKLPARRGP